MAEVDAAPLVDETTGRILDFIHAPDEVKRGVWPRAVERLRTMPYAAALVAQADEYGYAIRLSEADMRVSPDPFGGQRVLFEIAACELPDRPFRSAADAQRAMVTAPRITLTGLTMGL